MSPWGKNKEAVSKVCDNGRRNKRNGIKEVRIFSYDFWGQYCVINICRKNPLESEGPEEKSCGSDSSKETILNELSKGTLWTAEEKFFY